MLPLERGDGGAGQEKENRAGPIRRPSTRFPRSKSLFSDYFSRFDSRESGYGDRSCWRETLLGRGSESCLEDAIVRDVDVLVRLQVGRLAGVVDRHVRSGQAIN